KILKLRPTVREFFWSKIRDGNNTSLWFDRWCVTGPLANHVSTCDMHRARLNPSAKVKDIVQNGSCAWPRELTDKYPVLIESTLPIMEDNSDFVMWRCCNGMVKKFSVSQVWSDIRFHDSKVDWYHMVWFPSCIPRHAFNLWLIIQRKLKTQDLIPSWDISHSLSLVCSLCEGPPDSHEHLFFECSVVCAIWNRMKSLAGVSPIRITFLIVFNV
nr:hypothetical protein [Tanacetum cinerariifolium]